MALTEYVTEIQHIGIPTNNMQESIDFYTGLGFNILYETINEIADEKVTFLGCTNIMLEIYENHKAKLESGSIDHICLGVRDIEAVFHIVKDSKLEIIEKGIQRLPFWEKGIRYFTIVGPNKEKIEFCQKL